MTDRDHFAAAALAGLIGNGDYGMDFVPVLAYEVADAMLRERGRTNHDAAPAAKATADRYVRRAAADGGSDRTDKAATRPSEGTGDTFTLTDAERSAIRDAASRYASITPESAETAATLRGLLERTK